MRTTLTPFLIALSSSFDTAGLVGVMAMPFTPFATMSWIAAISPASSVALFPCAKTTVASLCDLSHFFAAFWSTKKKSTGNFVMNPSLTVASLACGADGPAEAPLASTATAASETATARAAVVRNFDITTPFQPRWTL